MMKISIVIPVLDSHDAVSRQVKHFRMMPLPDDVELILVDDGSDLPLKSLNLTMKNLSIYETNDKRPWTQGLARNLGAEKATGEYLLMTDIDHIISKEAIEAVRGLDGDKMVFPRYLAVLSKGGRIRQDWSILEAYGCDMAKAKRRKLYASVHGNTFAMKKETFHMLGGYNPKRCQYGYHAPVRMGEDCYFNQRWNHYAHDVGKKVVMGPRIYMFPVGRYNVNGDSNPMGLFHRLNYDAPATKGTEK